MRTANMPDDATLRFTLLDQTRAALEQAHGDWRMPWGEANRIQRTHWSGESPFDDNAPSLPMLGAPGWTGIVFNAYTSLPSTRGRAYATAGNSYVSIVEFSARTHARSIVYFGQSGDPHSPHYFDQAPLLARGDFKLAPTTLAEILATTERTYHPGD
jgi:acyl-homoserine-lactone acylase